MWIIDESKEEKKERDVRGRETERKYEKKKRERMPVKKRKKERRREEKKNRKIKKYTVIHKGSPVIRNAE